MKTFEQYLEAAKENNQQLHIDDLGKWLKEKKAYAAWLNTEYKMADLKRYFGNAREGSSSLTIWDKATKKKIGHMIKMENRWMKFIPGGKK